MALVMMLSITALFALANDYGAPQDDILSSEPAENYSSSDNTSSGDYSADGSYDGSTSSGDNGADGDYDNASDGYDDSADGGYDGSASSDYEDSASGGYYTAAGSENCELDCDCVVCLEGNAAAECDCGEHYCVICNLVFAPFRNNPIDEAELRAEVAAAAGMGPVTIQLMNDISLTSGALIIPSGAEITLNGGYTLWRTANMTVAMAPPSGRVMILVESGGSLTIDGINITRSGFNNTAASSMRAIEVENGASLTLASGAISGFDSAQLRFATVAVNSGGTFTMTGGHIANNLLVGTVPGEFNGNSAGGVYVAPDATFTMTGGYISSNRMSGVVVDGLFTLNGGTINGNSGGAGAGVDVRSTGQFNMHSGLIDNNWDQGPWLANQGEYNIQTSEGGGVRVLGTFDMYGGTITRNRTAFAGGGGVLVGRASAGTGDTGVFRMHGGNITNNMAWIGGGVSVSGDGTFIMNGGNITNNEAIQRGGGGGGVLVHHSSRFTMRGGTISGNTASGRAFGSAGGGGFGGGVLVFSGNFTMEAGTISGNTAIAAGPTATPAGSGIGSGGGVAVITANATFNAIGGQITSNTAQFGGGVYTRANFTIPATGTIAISSNNATHNTHGGGDGAGVFVSSGTFTMNSGMIGGNEAEYGNSASIRGGGVYVQGGTFNLDGGTIRYNNGLTTHQEGGRGRGGGVVNRATFNMQGGTISDNSAYAAGGVENSGSFTMQGGVISNNTATINETLSGSTGLGGGGVQNTVDGTFEMSGGRISRNTAWRGGGIHTWGCTTLSDAAVIGGDGAEHGNTAHNVGGGVYVREGGTLSMNSGVSVATVAFNTAGTGGGGINNGGTFTMHDGIIRNNSVLNAAGNGGGVANRDTFTMHDGLIENNTAIGNPPVSGGSGGGVGNLAHSTFIMHDGTIRGNTAGHIGGGVNNSHIFYMHDGEIYNNTAFNHGGGVCTFGVFTMNAGTIRNNSATGQNNIDGIMSNGNGGGIFNWSGTVHITSSDAEVRDNQARQWGGGIMNHTPGTLKINGGGVVRNNTANQGGGIMNNGATITVQDGRISGNTATAIGGGVFSTGAASTLNISGNSIVSGNTAGTDGGGIFMTHYTNLTVASTAVFTGNSANASFNLGLLRNISNADDPDTFELLAETSGPMASGFTNVSGNPRNISWASTSFCEVDSGTLALITDSGRHLLNNFDVAYRGENHALVPTLAAPRVDYGTVWRITGARHRLIGTAPETANSAILGAPGTVTDMTGAAGNFTIAYADILDPTWSLMLTATPFFDSNNNEGAVAVARRNGHAAGNYILPDSATGVLNAGTVLDAARRTSRGIPHDAETFHWNDLLYDIMAEITYEGSTGLSGRQFQSTFTWWIANTP